MEEIKDDFTVRCPCAFYSIPRFHLYHEVTLDRWLQKNLRSSSYIIYGHNQRLPRSLFYLFIYLCKVERMFLMELLR
jgi:hypothetical protein